MPRETAPIPPQKTFLVIQMPLAGVALFPRKKAWATLAGAVNHAYPAKDQRVQKDKIKDSVVWVFDFTPAVINEILNTAITDDKRYQALRELPHVVISLPDAQKQIQADKKASEASRKTIRQHAFSSLKIPPSHSTNHP